jgi:hypothetical protein
LFKNIPNFPSRRHQEIEDIDRADVPSIYLTDIGEPADQFEVDARIERHNELWDDKKLLVSARPVRPTSDIAATAVARDATSGHSHRYQSGRRPGSRTRRRSS